MRDLDKYHNVYCNLPFEELQIHFRRKKVIEFLEKYNHSIICEVGCGLDPVFKHLTTFERMHVVEPIQKFYENACVEAKNKDNITLHLGKLEEVTNNLINKNFNCIIVSGLLHEVNNPEELLESIYAISSADTMIHINVPNAKSFHRILAYEMGMIKNIFERSINQDKLQQSLTFDLERLKSLVSKKGFSIVESGSYFVKPFTHKQMQELLSNKIIDIEILNGLDSIVKYMPEMGSEIFINVKK